MQYSCPLAGDIAIRNTQIVYRDHTAALDEHDRAVGAILIGEALVDDCERAAVQLRCAENEPDRWRAVTEIHDAYPEIWRHLDRARRVLATRGANTVGYDDLRPHVRRAPTNGDDSAIDRTVLDDVKRAIAELKLAVPGAEWDAIEARTQGLVHAPLGRRRRYRLALAGVVAAFALATVSWFAALVPDKHAGRTDQMRRELAQIQQDRKLKIDAMRLALGDRCEPALAHELIKQLVLDGRGSEARQLAGDYIERCGYDSVVDHWGHAPRPGH
jgi:hypothetical protein